MDSKGLVKVLLGLLKTETNVAASGDAIMDYLSI